MGSLPSLTARGTFFARQLHFSVDVFRVDGALHGAFHPIAIHLQNELHRSGGFFAGGFEIQRVAFQTDVFDRYGFPILGPADLTRDTLSPLSDLDLHLGSDGRSAPRIRDEDGAGPTAGQIGAEPERARNKQ